MPTSNTKIAWSHAITTFLIMVSLIVSLGAALKAIKVDPLVALRCE